MPAEFFQKRSQLTLEDDEQSGQNDLTYDPPVFDLKEDYFTKFWSSLVDNENILKEVQDVAHEN